MHCVAALVVLVGTLVELLGCTTVISLGACKHVRRAIDVTPRQILHGGAVRGRCLQAHLLRVL